MEDDSVTFGSPAAGATPGNNFILAQPPLEAEASPITSGQGVDQALEGIRIHFDTLHGLLTSLRL